ncbi:MAG: hypothetical protein ACRDIB_13945 [Ardenticatenaceae bacterium]
MAENNTSLPTFESLDELVTFFETQDMGQYWEALPEVHFNVDLQRRLRLVAVDETLFQKLARIANSHQVSTEELIDS